MVPAMTKELCTASLDAGRLTIRCDKPADHKGQHHASGEGFKVAWTARNLGALRF